MDGYLLRQSVLRRALADTGTAQRGSFFMWLGELSGAAVGLYLYQSVISGLGGLFVAAGLVLLWNLFIAPYRQRNEARRIASDWRSSLRLCALRIIEHNGDAPIDLPELMSSLGLEHGQPDANRLMNEIIRELDGQITFRNRGSLGHGWTRRN